MNIIPAVKTGVMLTRMKNTHAPAAFGPIVPLAHSRAMKRNLYVSASVAALMLGFDGLELWEVYPRLDLAAFTGQAAEVDPKRDARAVIRELKQVLAELKALNLRAGRTTG